MRTRRTPFYGDPEDRAILGPDYLKDVVGPFAGAENGSQNTEDPANTVHPVDLLAEAEQEHANYREMGTEIALGFVPHEGENRKTRRAAVATWVPPNHAEQLEKIGAAVPNMPTRRELWRQRQRQRRGKLDPETRRLQRKATK